MNETIFRGVATAIVTPMNREGVDYSSFARLLDWQIAEGVNALVIAGSFRKISGAWWISGSKNRYLWRRFCKSAACADLLFTGLHKNTGTKHKRSHTHKVLRAFVFHTIKQ